MVRGRTKCKLEALLDVHFIKDSLNVRAGRGGERCAEITQMRGILEHTSRV